MTNPLTSLDELIWKQFEKVTIAAEKRLGWDKWDLVKVTDTAFATLLTGWGVYTSIMGISGNNNYGVAGGVLLTLLGGAAYLVFPYNQKMDQNKEEKLLLATGAVLPPQFTGLRPAILGLSSGLLVEAAYYFFVGTDKVPSELPSLSIGQYNLLYGLTSLTIGGATFFMTCSSYFKSQLPRSPSTAKKSLWQALADYVTKPFHKEQQPVEVPAAKYIAERVHL